MSTNYGHMPILIEQFYGWQWSKTSLWVFYDTQMAQGYYPWAVYSALSFAQGGLSGG